MRNSLKALLGVLVAGSVLLLAGCSSPTNPAESPTPSDTPSATETSTPTPTETPTETPAPTVTGTPTPLADPNGIVVTGDFNGATAPTVTAPYPFNVDTTSCTVLTKGNGNVIAADSAIEVQYLGINASTGEQFDSSWTRGQPMLAMNGGFVTGFNNCLTGQAEGSRVLMLISGPDGYDSQGGNSQVGINVGDTLLFVVDILVSGVDAPTGTHLADGNQWVDVVDKDGVPTATVKPGVAAPTGLQTTVLIQGIGPAIKAQDAIYVNFLIQDYATGQTIENSWTGEGVTPDQYGNTVQPQANLLTNLIPGWQQALVGQKIGSRVLIIVPGNLAYPQGNATPAITPNATLVCVVDVLFSFIPQQQGA